LCLHEFFELHFPQEYGEGEMTPEYAVFPLQVALSPGPFFFFILDTKHTCLLLLRETLCSLVAGYKQTWPFFLERTLSVSSKTNFCTCILGKRVMSKGSLWLCSQDVQKSEKSLMWNHVSSLAQIRQVLTIFLNVLGSCLIHTIC
jgi:hypothetical protein